MGESGAFNTISLFSGVGGIELGLKLAVPAARTVCYVEWNRHCQAVLQARMRDGLLDAAPIWDNVTTFDGRPWRGRVHCVAGGFPCQDISCAGKRAGFVGERSSLWFEFARVIHEVGPDFVFVENVDELVNSELYAVLGSLAGLGYAAEWDVFSGTSWISQRRPG